jgi:phosphate starvation-inducible protein PhoH
MVSLVGQRDELLKLIEGAFDASILVRGNEITIDGTKEELDRVATLFDELLALLEKGHVRTRLWSTAARRSGRRPPDRSATSTRSAARP